MFGSSAASASLRMLGTERRKWATSLRTKSRIPASTFAAALRLPLRNGSHRLFPFFALSERGCPPHDERKQLAGR